MSLPSQTLTSALAIVNASVNPSFIGPGNQGFLPFGPDDAQHSTRVSNGVYKMRLKSRVDFTGGEGKISCGPAIGTVVGPSNVANVYWAHDINEQAVIHVLCDIGGNPGDFPFWCEVTRTPQSLT